MSALPRLLAVTSEAIGAAPDFATRVTRLAGLGPALALVVRAPGLSAARQAELAEQVLALARPADVPVIVHARPDLARAIGAQGVQLRAGDLAPDEARRVMPHGWIGVSVHSRDEAVAAIAAGADYLVAGNVYLTASHPDRPAQGVAWLRSLSGLGRPVVAIGGVTPERAVEVQRAGAWGIAVIRAVWEAAEPRRAAEALLAPWRGEQ